MLKAQGEYNLHITLSATFSMFSVNQVSFCAHMRFNHTWGTLGYSLIRKTFVDIVCTDFDPEGISGRAQSLERIGNVNDHDALFVRSSSYSCSIVILPL